MGYLENTDLIQYSGWIGTPEIIIIAIIILLLFGGKKIPELMRGLRKGIKEYNVGRSNNDDTKDKTENTRAGNKNMPMVFTICKYLSTGKNSGSVMLMPSLT